MDAIEAIKTRRSVRVYEQRPIPRQVLLDLVDCARLAPTAMNQQLWEFVVVSGPEICKKIGVLIPHAHFLPTAPAVIAVICKENACYVEDGSAATQNILLAAHAHGLGACWIAGHRQPYSEPVRRLLEVPEGYHVLSLVTLGYPAEKPAKEKRALESMLHWEKF